MWNMIKMRIPCLVLLSLFLDVGGSERDEQKRRTTVDFENVNFGAKAPIVAMKAMDPLVNGLEDRLTDLFSHAHTEECRAKIAQHMGYFTSALAKEEPMPFFEMSHFDNTCEDEIEWDFDNLPEGVHMGIIQNRTYQPPRNETTYISPTQVVFCYGILAHDDAAATIRLIESVTEPSTLFVVHIDGKFEETYLTLKEYASSRPKITVLDHPYRVRVNWGGFSMVNATMQLFHFADKLSFTHFVHMAASAYPIASNRRIRNTIASYPKDSNFMHVILKPARPHNAIWNYYVECDDRLHRIYRLAQISKETHGADIYTTSQWFIISREFVNYFANPKPGSFLSQFLEYIEHVVVADEGFFGTVLRHTPFCNKHHNWHFLHLEFDQWENERDLSLRDERKCVMPDPNHCGRSPTTITMDYLDILELSGDLFARKFNNDADSKVKDAIDDFREQEELELVSKGVTDPGPLPAKVNLSLDGHGALIVAKETVNSKNPLCLGLGETRNKVRLVPCFESWVPRTLASNWHHGAVVSAEALPHNQWEIGPCSSDGDLVRLENGEINVTSGKYKPTGPRCNIRMMDGIRTGRCIDGNSLDDNQPGGPSHVFPCSKKWNQFFSFGNGKDVPNMALHLNVPKHTRQRIAETGRIQEQYMCLGVEGRGDDDDEDWFGERENDDDEYYETDDDDDDDDDESDAEIDDNDEASNNDLPPLRNWNFKQLVATKCSNAGGVIEWVVVPFIVEDETSPPIIEDEKDL